jgi:hypothetical protein
MANNEFIGSSLWAQWVSSGGTVQLDTEYRNFQYTPSLDTVDVTAGADSGKRWINSFKSGNAKITMMMQNDMGTAWPALCAEGIMGTLTWGEAGTAAGKAKVTLPSMCLGMTRTIVYNDAVSVEINWVQNGGRTDGTF